MTAKGELPLGFDLRSLFRIGLAAFVVGDALGTVWLLALNRLLDLRWWYQDEPDALPMFFNVGLWCGAGTAAIALGLLIFRQPRGAKVTWDGGGITLWDGDRAKTTIDWSKAKVATMTTYLERKNSDTASYVGSMLELRDDEGRSIHLSEGTQLWYLNGHKTSTPLAPLMPMLVQLPSVSLTPRGFGTTALSWIVAIGAYALMGLGLGSLTKSYGNEWVGVQMLLAGAGLFWMRTLYTAGTLRRTPADDPARRRALVVEIAIRLAIAPMLALPAFLYFQSAGAPAPWIEIARFGSRTTLSPGGQYAAHYQAWQIDLSDVMSKELRGQRRLDADYDVTPMAVSRDGRVVYRGRDGELQIWGTGDRVVATSGKHDHNLEAMEISGDGRLLITGSQDRTAKVWSLESGELLRTISGHERAVRGVGIDRDGSVLFTAGEDKTAFLWDGRNGEKIVAFEPAASWITIGALAEDGTRAATGDDQGTVRIFDAGGAKLHQIRAHEQQVHLMVFSPDAKLLATAGFDRAIKIFDERGEAIVTVDLRKDHDFRESGEIARSLAFTERALLIATERSGVLAVELTPRR